jgi:hypothetical protein
MPCKLWIDLNSIASISLQVSDNDRLVDELVCQLLQKNRKRIDPTNSRFRFTYDGLHSHISVQSLCLKILQPGEHVARLESRW